MATWPVRFEFYCGKEELKFIHNVPRSLVNAGTQVAEADAFLGTILPIMKMHELACREASDGACGICGSPATTVLQIPASWLHNMEDPFVGVWVNPICGKGECETQTRQEVQEIMAEAVGEGQDRRGSKSSAYVEIMACRICGKTEETMRCARCKVAAYCGKDHQKADWSVHKAACIPKAGRSS